MADSPKIVDQIKSLASTVVETAKTGAVWADSATTEARRRICVSCECFVTNWETPRGKEGPDPGIDWKADLSKFDENNAKLAKENACLPRCRSCGCGIANKTKVSGSRCPLGKW